MAYGTRVKFDAIRELDFGDVSGTYAAIGTPTTDYARIISINSSLDDEVYISTDGSTNEIRLSSNSFILLDLSSNKVRDDGLFIPIGTQFYVKQVSGAVSSGSVWITIVYAEGGK